MAEILLDTNFWNKVFKQLPPPLCIIITFIKGYGKDKLLPTQFCVNLFHHKDNKAGYLLKRILEITEEKNPSRYTDEGFYIKKAKIDRIKECFLKSGIDGNDIALIEKTILHVCINSGLIHERATYNGEPVVERRSDDFKSTECFGFVYFIRNQDIYKIGITDNLLRRIGELKPDEIINVVRCVNYKDLEKKLHSKFKSSRIPQTEYFRLDQGEVSLVNELMTDLAQFRE